MMRKKAEKKATILYKRGLILQSEISVTTQKYSLNLGVAQHLIKYNKN